MGADRPRVFQPGTLTVVFGNDGQSVYVGGTLLTLATGVSVPDSGPPRVRFRRPGKQDKDLLDEECRAARSAGFDFTQG